MLHLSEEDITIINNSEVETRLHNNIFHILKHII